MKNTSFVVDSIQDFQKSMDAALSGNFKPTLGIIFASVKLDIPELAKILNQYPIDFLACSSCGEILSQPGSHSVFEGSCVVTLIDMPADYFRIRMLERENRTSFELGRDLGIMGKSDFENPAYIVVCSSLNTDGEQLVNGLLESASVLSPIFGGLAGDDSLFQLTYVFSRDFCSTDGAIALVLDNSKLEVEGIATSGWIGLGAEKTVTKADGNIVYTIENEKALDFYIKYMGVDEKELPEIGVEYPMLVLRDDGSSVLRAVMMVDREKRSLIFAGSVPQGSKVKFSSSPGFEVVDFVKKDINQFFAQNKSADILLLFSCMARHMAVGPMVEDEIVEAATLWKLPVTGFFTYGEIGRNLKGSCDFHNETYTLVTIKRI